MFKRLKLRLTLLCTLITGIILTGMAYGALAIARGQQLSSSRVAFQSDYNSIVYHLQSQTVLDRSWLAQTENGNRLVIHIEDNGVPLLFEGAFTTLTPRSVLVGRCREEAARLGFDPGSPPASGLAADGIFYEIRGDHGERYRAASAAVPTKLGWVSLTLLKDMRAEDAQQAVQARLFAALTLIGTLLLFIFSLWFTGRTLRPIEQNHERQVQFVAAASHELRTPLAVIQASASAIAQATPAEAKRFSGVIHKECVRMSRLVNDLLLLARADANTWTIRSRPVEVDTLLLSTSEQFEGVAAQKGISLSVLLDEDERLPQAAGDEQRLSQVLSILIDNAVSYTPPGGSIRLGAYAFGESIRVTVSDTGPGIPPEEKKRIFDRFYRVDRSRGQKDHYGLGLSIAKEILELHHGRISVRDNAGGRGSTFVVELPALPQEKA